MDNNVSPSQTRQPLILGITTTLTILTVVAVALRFFARIKSGNRLWWDDWSILASLPLYIALNAIAYWDVHIGYGKHLAFVNPEYVLPRFFHSFYFSELTYNTSLALTKASLLFLFVRIFPTKRMRLSCYVLGALVAGWFVATEFAIIFQCTPIRKAWDTTIAGHCTNLRAFLLGQGIPSIIMDFAILCQPFPFIFKLQMPLHRKISVASIFAVGLFASVCSIARLVTVMGAIGPDITYDWPSGTLWTQAEAGTVIICACMPTLAPLFRSRKESSLSGYEKRTSMGGRSTNSEQRFAAAHIQMPSRAHDDEYQTFSACAYRPKMDPSDSDSPPSSRKSSDLGPQLELGNIRVQNDYYVVEEPYRS